MSDNPYAAPTTDPENLTNSTQDEDIRNEHFSTESSIKSIGVLYYLASFAGILGTIGVIIDAEAIEAIIALPLLTILFGFVGYGLRKFRTWAKIVATFFSVIGLLGVPLGTIINLYFLCLFWSKKGRMVFTIEYQNIIAATPHLKYRTSKTAWIVLAVFVLVVMGIIIFLSITNS